MKINTIQKIALFAALLFFAMPQAGHAMSAEYNIIVSDFGDAYVAINIDGSGNVILPLPLDSHSLKVNGALYTKTETGDLSLYVGSTKAATVTYETSLYTGKADKIWTFSAKLPKGLQTNVLVFLPAKVEITDTQPAGETGQIQDSEKITWNLNQGADEVNAKYHFVAEVAPAAPVANSLLMAIGALILLGILGGAFYFWQTFIKKQERQKQAAMPKERKVKAAEKAEKTTKGKQDVMKALTENEAKIVNLLIENKGTLKRNKLEFESRISKSSLAAALANLERRNIVQIDRSRTVHIVELTDWFKNL